MLTHTMQHITHTLYFHIPHINSHTTYTCSSIHYTFMWNIHTTNLHTSHSRIQHTLIYHAHKCTHIHTYAYSYNIYKLTHTILHQLGDHVSHWASRKLVWEAGRTEGFLNGNVQKLLNGRQTIMVGKYAPTLAELRETRAEGCQSQGTKTAMIAQREQCHQKEYAERRD